MLQSPHLLSVQNSEEDKKNASQAQSNILNLKLTSMTNLDKLVRPNIREFLSCINARTEQPTGQSRQIMLDANENPYNKPFNRYPSDSQEELKTQLAKLKGVTDNEIFLSNGSTEAIDMCYRIFCQPRVDNVVAIEPTCGLYRQFAAFNDVEYRPVLLDHDFQLDAIRLLKTCDRHTKLIWLCSPNTPNGNLLDTVEVEKVLKTFNGIVIIDEAYSDFSRQQPFREQLTEFPNMIVLNTFSKAWANAAIRLGVTYAQEAVIDLFNKVKYPYNINQLTQEQAVDALKHRYDIEDWIKNLLLERQRMMKAFESLACCEQVYPSDANFFLARMKDAQGVYDYLTEKGIVVHNCFKEPLCDNCLRITIGSKAENAEILGILRYYKPTK